MGNTPASSEGARHLCFIIKVPFYSSQIKTLICSDLQNGSNPRPLFSRDVLFPWGQFKKKPLHQSSLFCPSVVSNLVVMFTTRSVQAGNTWNRGPLWWCWFECSFFTGFWWLLHGWRWPRTPDFWWLSHTCWSDHLAADRCAFHWSDTQPAWLLKTKKDV